MNDNNETRMTAEWEPRAKVKRGGFSRRSLVRKLVTNGVKEIGLPGTIEAIEKLLRQGYEVRLTDGKSEAAIRIYPLLSTDCKRIYPQAATMGGFTDCLSGFKPKVFHRGQELDDVTLRMQRNIAAENYAERKKLCVTPDTMVTCPNCGTEFRVGSKLKS